MELTLNDKEREFLQNTLEQCHRELLNEIAHTDSREYRKGLSSNEELLASLLTRLHDTSVLHSRG